MALAVAMMAGCPRTEDHGPERGAAPAATLGVLAPADTARQLGEIRAQLRADSEWMSPCRDVGAQIAKLDALLDAAPSSAEGFHLLGEALQLASEACPGEAPRSRQAARAGDAFVEARKRFLGDAGAGSTEHGCIAGEPLAAGRALAAAGRWAEATEAYRRELYGGCDAGLHWHGTRLFQRGDARLELARAAVALRDAFEARRQLHLLDFERLDSTLHLGNATEEEALCQRLDRAPPAARPRHPSSPEEAVRALERAAFFDDAVAFGAALAREAPDRRRLTSPDVPERPCDRHGGGDWASRARTSIVARAAARGPERRRLRADDGGSRSCAASLAPRRATCGSSRSSPRATASPWPLPGGRTHSRQGHW